MSGGKVYTAGEFLPVVVDLSADSTTVNTKSTILRGVSVKTAMSAHACVISNGSTALFTIPASSAAGTWIPFGDVVLGGGIVVDPDNAATGEIVLVMKELP